MTDTQLPRFMVFQQHEPGEAFVHNGTVHSADPEMALLTARDVFSRRPRAIRMWVVPAEAIYSMTREELQIEELQIADEDKRSRSMNPHRDFHIFAKTHEQGQCEHFGTVQAESHEQAMKLAVDTYKDKDALWWWVFPAEAVHSTEEEDADSMFEPVLDKHYREQAQYPVVTMMREIRAKRSKDE